MIGECHVVLKLYKSEDYKVSSPRMAECSTLDSYLRLSSKQDSTRETIAYLYRYIHDVDCSTHLIHLRK